MIAGLVHTDKGITCLDSGLMDLLTEQECSIAVHYAKSFNGNAQHIHSGSWTRKPKGCSIYDDGKMYFNTHSSGNNNANTRSICKTGNQYSSDYYYPNYLKSIYDCKQNVQRSIIPYILDSMACVPGTCKSRISDTIFKSQSQIEEMCKNNAKCLAYDYTTKFGHGHLCDSPSINFREFYAFFICKKGKIGVLHGNKL